MGLVDLGSNSTRLILPLHSACYGESFLPRSLFHSKLFMGESGERSERNRFTLEIHKKLDFT